MSSSDLETIQKLASTCRVPTASDSVLNSECCYTFQSPYHDDGLLVNLNTWIGTCEAMCMLHSSSPRQIFVKICKERVLKKTVDDPTKVAIGVEGGFQTDKYDVVSTHYITVCEKSEDGAPSVVTQVKYDEKIKNDLPTQVGLAADAVIAHAGMTLQQDVQAWALDQEDIPISKYATKDLPFVDNGVKISPNVADWKCEKSGDTENIWLNLSDGYIGGGRKHWDGSGGSNGALDHFNDTGKQYPLVVKLGTIHVEPSGKVSADCYSYAPDEDGPVMIPNLAELLQKRGINVAGMQKTVKSTAELEVELNANYAFDAITEAGSELQAMYGPNYQGLQNLGNSCYLNSIVQALAMLPEVKKRYGVDNGNDITKLDLLTNVSPTAAPSDVLCQTTKLVAALTSGRYSRPKDTTEIADEDDPRFRLAPRMFKHLIGKDHAEFRTNQQQDAAQFLQHLLDVLHRAELGKLPGDTIYPTDHLFSFQTESRMVCTADGKVKYKTHPAESVLSLPIPMDKAVVLNSSPNPPEHKRQKPDGSSDEVAKPIPTISLDSCLDSWAADHIVDGIQWAHIGKAVSPARQSTRFSTFPRYLWVQVQRYTIGADWTPIKLEVNLDLPKVLDIEKYKTSGPQEGEELVPEDPEGALPKSGPVIDEMALSQLMDMGFSLNSCKRALNAVGGSDVEAAMGWVFEHNNDPDFNDPLPEGGDAPQMTDDGVDEGIVQSLVDSLGCFTSDQVRAALKATDNAADRAADWLFSHMDDLDGAIAALSKSSITGNTTSSSSSLPLDDGPGKYELFGMVSHIGKNTGSGHYVAHLKKDGQWAIFNDEKVALSEHPPFAHAYLYLYQRQDTVGKVAENY